MKELIKEFKQENGNSNFTQKEMIMYVIKKLEKIDDRLIDGEKTFISKSLVYKITGFIISCLGALLWFILSLHKVV